MGYELANLGYAADTTAEATEGNSLLVLGDVLQVRLSLLQHHTLDVNKCEIDRGMENTRDWSYLDCVACLAGVLEVNTEVRSLGVVDVHGR